MFGHINILNNLKFQQTKSDEFDLSTIADVIPSLEYEYEPANENAQIHVHPENFGYDYETKSRTHQMSEFLQHTYFSEIKSMRLTNKNTNSIFKLSLRLVEEYTQLCRSLLISANDNKINVLELSLDWMRQQFSEECSTFKRQQNLEKNELYVPPQQKAIGTHWEMIRSRSTNSTIPRLLQSKFHYISILQTIQSLFKQKEFLKMYFEYNMGANRHRCVEGVYKHFCCGKVFKQSELFSSQPHALQIQIATDDFEICDPIGSKSGVHKMCPIYFCIKNVPNQYLSKLSNIYLVSLCRTDDLKTKETDFNDLWEQIVSEIVYLEKTGIQIDPNTNIKGTIIYPSFDNLGGNQTLGFVESFNSHFCRFCIASKHETETMITEDQSMVRTVESYESHLEIVAESQKVCFAETKGIKRNCALNKLNYFHILNNKSVDVMHDLNEGCILFLLKNLFKYFISKKVFNLDYLQKQVQYFDFGPYCKNTPSLINIKKENLNQNSSQLICIFRNIGFILHKYRKDNTVKKAWKCVESLQNIVQICYSSEIKKADVKNLEQYISKHLQSIIDILKLQLIPKHHLLTHYPSIILEMGPVCHMSMLRFESKHKSLKNIAKQGNNWINITKTISTRNQAELIFNGFTYCDEIDCGKITTINMEKLIELEQEALANIADKNELICEVQWLNCNNFTYRKNSAVLHEHFFYEIDRILVVEDKYFLLCSRFHVVEFDNFTHSYILEKFKPSIKLAIFFDDLNLKKPHDIKIFEGKSFIFAETLYPSLAM